MTKEPVEEEHIWVDAKGKQLFKLVRKDKADDADPVTEADAWNWLTTKASRLQTLVPPQAYNSGLSKDELTTVDLFANAQLYPTPINKLGECRTKDSHAAVNTIP